MSTRSLLAILAGLLALAPSARADVTLPNVFSDHMVLQCDMAAPVFGKAAVGERVTVEINGRKKAATADTDGNWLVKLDPLKAGAGPFELKVTGKNAITIKDVLVGEVWVASGQSNMRYTLARTTEGKDEVAAANHPQIRYVIGVGKWDVCSPRTAGNYSGVAYHFAVELQKARKVPVGIIDNSVSGALGQQFMSPAGIASDSAVAAYVKKRGEASDIWKASFVPIIPYGIRGALWYQGEGNRDVPVTYAKLLPALIADWRAHWGQGDFPFLIVQLANYQERKADPWEGKDCALREAQLKTAMAVKNTALTVTIDLGIAKDVHYPDKKPVGQRLAVAARGLAYGEKIEYSGPLFESAKFEGGKAVVSFTHAGGGLVAKGGGKLSGFLICGEDRKFVRAEAKVEGGKVVVWSDAVKEPVAVRYAWERNPECNLTNKEGLPASPFRSDTFENFFTKDS